MHLYDFPILRSRLYWPKYKPTSKTEIGFNQNLFLLERFYDSKNMMEEE